MCQIASLYPSRSAAALPHTNFLPFSDPFTLTSLLVYFHLIYKITVTDVAGDEFRAQSDDASLGLRSADSVLLDGCGPSSFGII